MPKLHSVSFRGQLQGEIQDFILARGISCVQTTHAIVDLAVEIARYEEEGRRLFPSILVCTSLSEALALVQGGSPLTIGVGPKEPQTAVLGLKKCAPLTRDAWMMFIECRQSEFHYGVFRPAQLPTSLDVRATLATLSEDVNGLFFLAPVAERVVELTGPAVHNLTVHFSAVRSTTQSPTDAMDRLVAAVSNAADEGIRESLRTYLAGVLRRALIEGHGALIAVVHADNPLPAALEVDARLFPTPIDLGVAVSRFLGERDAGSFAELRAFGALLEGMLGSDGITIIRSDGSLVGYNSFIRLDHSSNDKPSEMAGGARMRAYWALCDLVGKKAILGAFFRSSNGTSKYFGGQSGEQR